MSDVSEVLAVRHASRSYGAGRLAVKALEDVDLVLEAGRLITLVGPSGSGKTTLLGLLCGWVAPDSGAVEVLAGARSPADLPWSEMALVPQALGLLEDLSIAENVALPLRWSASTKVTAASTAPTGRPGDRVDYLLDRFGIDHLAHRLPSEASLGEQQRASVARALVTSPAVLLADEPSAHQDAVWAVALFDALRAAADEGAACLVATHDPAAAAVADRVIHLRDGTVIVD
jgi:putative ABC transport system ATP-binding protein